jgi:hypothetical protein
MPFIGNQPTAVPLSADDLEDNIISTAKIQDNAVTPAKYIEPVPFRNIIINGDMSIAQRGTSESGITSGNIYHTVDRFLSNVELGTWTQSQSTDVPTGQGFSNSLKMDCTTADASPSANDVLQIQQRFEGQNLQYLKKGTSNAESLTLSFWVKSNKTGTYIIEVQDTDNDRIICKSYTVSASSTWEKKTITFAGDTTGAFNNDNALSLLLIFWLSAGTDFTTGTLATDWESRTNANRAVGQVNLADSTSNDFYITGVQLEAGTTASDFEFLPYDVNLQRCQRYYNVLRDGVGVITNAISYSSTKLYAVVPVSPPLRTTPSLDQVSGTNYYGYINVSTTDSFDAFEISGTESKDNAIRINNSDNVAITAGQSGWIRITNSSGYLALDAEL